MAKKATKPKGFTPAGKSKKQWVLPVVLIAGFGLVGAAALALSSAAVPKAKSFTNGDYYSSIPMYNSNTNTTEPAYYTFSGFNSTTGVKTSAVDFEGFCKGVSDENNIAKESGFAGITQDGKTVYRACSYDNTGVKTYTVFLRAMNMDGTNLRTLASFTQETGKPLSYAVSSDAGKVAYAENAASGLTKIRMYNTVTGKKTYFKTADGPVSSDPTVISYGSTLGNLAFLPGNSSMMYTKDRRDDSLGYWTYDVCKHFNDRAPDCRALNLGAYASTHKFYSGYMGDTPWSLDGKSGLLKGEKLNTYLGFEYFRFRWSDGSVTKLELKTPMSDPSIESNPLAIFSPDATKVAYSTTAGAGKPHKTYIYDIANSRTSAEIANKIEYWRPVPVY